MPCPQHRAELARGGAALSDHIASTVDARPDALCGTGKRAEIDEPALPTHARVKRHDHVAVTCNLSRVVDGAGHPELSSRNPCQVRDDAGPPYHRMRKTREGIGVALANDLTLVVDAEGDTVDSTREPAKVDHRALLPEEGVAFARWCLTLADDLASVIDGVCEAE